MNDKNLFSSEIVKREAEVMYRLYRDVTQKMYRFADLSKEEKLQMFDDMDTLVEKQQILYTRVMLSDDDDSEMVKENFRIAAKQMGIPTSQVGPEVFRLAKQAVDSLRETLEAEEG